MTFSSRPSRSDDHLSNYWNALVHNAPAEELARLARLVEPSEIAAIERAHAAHQRYEPDPDFARRLEQTLMDASTLPIAGTIPQPRVSPPSRNGSRHPDPISHRRALAPPSRAGWSLLPAVAAGLVILLVLASIGGVWFTSSRQDEPHRLMAPIVATPSLDASSDVPMYRANPERTGVMPGPGIEGQPVELWRADVKGSIETAPALVDGVLYLGVGDGGLYAYDATSGEEIWVFQGTSPIMASPAVQNGIVYSGSEDGTLYAIDADTGMEVWALPGTQSEVAVAVVGNAVYTGGGDGFLYALDAATGDELWRAPLDAEAARSPALSDGVVYIGSADGVLHTFDAVTGEPGWARKLEGDGTISTTVVTGGVVYEGTFGGDATYFFALDATTGEELWRFETESGEGFYTAATDGKTVYTVSDDSNVYALDAATGEELWRFETSENVTAAPALVDDTLYVGGNDGILYAIETGSGEEIWRFALEGSVGYGPVVADGVAYVGTFFGYFYAIGGSGEPAMATPAATPVASTATSATSTNVAEFVWEAGREDGLSGQPYDVTIAPDGTIWTMGEVIQLLDADGFVIETWTEPDPSTTLELSEGAIHFDREGNLHIVDTPNHRVLKFGADGELLFSWGSKGQGDGQFEQASDLVIDSEGNVYIVDVVLQRIQKFDPDGTFLATISGPGEGEGQLSATARMGIDQDDNLYVPDGSQVEVFAPDGTFLRSFGAGNLRFAVDAAVDENGIVYVSDAQQNQIQVYDPNGNLLGSWGAFGREPGNFIEVDALSLDDLGNLYVVDFRNQRIQKFRLHPSLVAMPGATPDAVSGSATFRWETASSADSAEMDGPGPVAVAPDETIWLTDSEGSRFHLYTPDGEYIESWGMPGQGDGQFDFAMSTDDGNAYGGIAFAPDGSFYVADTGNRRIQHFSADREFLGAWGEFGPDDGQFLKPLDVVVDSQGDVFVIDELREVIQKFDATGTHLLTFGGSGSADGQFDFVAWIAIDASDSIWIADAGNSRIQQFENDGTFIAAFDGNGTLVEPWEVAVDDAGTIYVADIGAGRVVVLDPTGDVIGSWGEAAEGPGKLRFPALLTLDGGGNVLVVDYLSDSTWEGRLAAYQLQPSTTGEATEATPSAN